MWIVDKALEQNLRSQVARSAKVARAPVTILIFLSSYKPNNLRRRHTGTRDAYEKKVPVFSPKKLPEFGLMA